MHDQTAVQLLNFKAGLAPYAQPEGCPPTVLVQLHYPPSPPPLLPSPFQMLQLLSPLKLISCLYLRLAFELSTELHNHEGGMRRNIGEVMQQGTKPLRLPRK